MCFGRAVQRMHLLCGMLSLTVWVDVVGDIVVVAVLAQPQADAAGAALGGADKKLLKRGALASQQPVERRHVGLVGGVEQLVLRGRNLAGRREASP